jgi:hypothetical protein
MMVTSATTALDDTPRPFDATRPEPGPGTAALRLPAQLSAGWFSGASACSTCWWPRGATLDSKSGRPDALSWLLRPRPYHQFRWATAAATAASALLKLS